MNNNKNIIKCSRCGKEIKISMIDAFNKIHQAHFNISLYIPFNGNISINLCDECMEKFEKWLNEK